MKYMAVSVKKVTRNIIDLLKSKNAYLLSFNMKNLFQIIGHCLIFYKYVVSENENR